MEGSNALHTPHEEGANHGLERRLSLDSIIAKVSGNGTQIQYHDTVIS